MSEQKTVTLTELEFHKLMRFSEVVSSVEAQAELALVQLREKVAAAHKQRETYFLQLAEKYPDIDKSIRYSVDEATFSLTPNVTEG